MLLHNLGCALGTGDDIAQLSIHRNVTCPLGQESLSPGHDMYGAGAVVSDSLTYRYMWPALAHITLIHKSWPLHVDITSHRTQPCDTIEEVLLRRYKSELRRQKVCRMPKTWSRWAPFSAANSATHVRNHPLTLSCMTTHPLDPLYTIFIHAAYLVV